METTYKYFYSGSWTVTDDRTKANNEAYYSGSTVYVQDAKDNVVDSFVPYKLDITNLIDDGFHNAMIKNNR